MTPENDDQREQRAKELAYALGRREADVDAHLRSHENRLNAINGSIEKHAKNAAALSASIDELGDKIDRVAASLVTRDAVEAERTDQLKRANEKQISNKMFWLGVAAIIATILGAIIASHGGGL
jgi:hypothetical protein